MPRLYERVRYQLKRQKIRLKLMRRGSFAQSTSVSLALRPLLERDSFKTIMTAPLMASIVAGGMLLPATDYAFSSWEIEQPVEEILAYDTVAPADTPNANYVLPVEALNGISQYYHGGHLGLDLRAPQGTVVNSLAAGTVELVEYSSLGYGRRVIVRHENDIRSMYAHLGEVEAEMGELVAAGEMLGTVGMSGWTTGPHLHLEVFVNEAPVNPLGYIGTAIEEYQTELLAGH